MARNNSLSIYVHWPFCLSKCPYCDFNSHVASSIDYEIWRDSYLKEIAYFRNIIEGKNIESIFFGGGTPSLMKPFIVESIINEIAAIAKVSENTEITLEANPTSFETTKFKEFKKAGINRISIGVQSFKDEDLRKLGRGHSSSEAIKAIESANEIFDRVSFDLIYSRAGQSPEDWREELEKHFYLATGHISLYRLTIEKATPFYKEFKEGRLILPEEDEDLLSYKWTGEFLKSKNYDRYEISNYGLKGEESRHNLVYWNYKNYLGLGPGAHSRIEESGAIHSIVNFYKPDKWLENLEKQGVAIQNKQKLSEKDALAEFFMMGLRLACGIDLKNLKEISSEPISDILDLPTIELYKKEGFLEYSQDNIKLTDKGIILHSYIAPRILK